jgi:hypothetical protein
MSGCTTAHPTITHGCSRSVRQRLKVTEFLACTHNKRISNINRKEAKHHMFSARHMRPKSIASSRGRVVPLTLNLDIRRSMRHILKCRSGRLMDLHGTSRVRSDGFHCDDEILKAADTQRLLTVQAHNLNMPTPWLSSSLPRAADPKHWAAKLTVLNLCLCS